MKKLHVYTVYMDDGDTFKVTVPAESEAAARKYVAGNGDVIAVKDAPLQDIDIGCLDEQYTYIDAAKNTAGADGARWKLT